MNYNWMECLLLGITSGLTDVLPVSAEAHSRILHKFLGYSGTPAMMNLLIHLGVFAALYLSCQPHILKMVRAKKLSRIPKRKRKRPLDVRSLMDLRLWQTMLVPVAVMVFFWDKLSGSMSNLVLVATFLFVNGLILYIPQFLPSGNKDCRSLSRVEGLLMGLGGMLFVIPGMSGVGAALSLASVTGVDKKYGLSMVLLLDMGILAGRIIYDLLELVRDGVGYLSFMLLIYYIVSAAAAFLGAWLAVKFLHNRAESGGYTLFAYYCWGLALFAFVLSLMA